MVSKKDRIYRIIALLLPSVLICGTRSYLGIEIFGLNVTIYRVLIPLVFLFLFFDNIKISNMKISSRVKSCNSNRFLLFFCIVLLCWIIYGVLSLMLSNYSVLTMGVRELLILFLSGLVVCIVLFLCERGCWDWLLMGIKIILFISLALGLWEIITGMHLSISRYSDPEYFKLVYGLAEEEASLLRRHLSTGFFYNENDFMAFLVIFSPVFAMDIQKKSVIEKISGCVSLGIIFYILYANDAFICLIAYLVCIVGFLFFSHADKLSVALNVGTLIISRVAVFLTTNKVLENSINNQIVALESEYGSMYYRINTYRITIRETFSVTKGLGFGAGSFTNYFQRLAQSEKVLLNPHCFWLEILAEYGVIIFILFIVFLILLYINLFKKVLKFEPLKTAVILSMGNALVIASVAPSSYLQQTYYWVAIALGIYLVDSFPNKKLSGYKYG